MCNKNNKIEKCVPPYENKNVPFSYKTNKPNENRLKIAECRILKGIYGPVKDNITHQYGMITNRELEELYNKPNIVEIIKSENRDGPAILTEQFNVSNRK